VHLLDRRHQVGIRAYEIGLVVPIFTGQTNHLHRQPYVDTLLVIGLVGVAYQVSRNDLYASILELTEEALLVGMEPFGLLTAVLLNRANVVARSGKLVRWVSQAANAWKLKSSRPIF
jgi:hypothetical protein